MKWGPNGLLGVPLEVGIGGRFTLRLGKHGRAIDCCCSLDNCTGMPDSLARKLNVWMILRLLKKRHRIVQSKITEKKKKAKY